METTALNTGLTFGEPMWLWALVLVPVLAAVFWRAQARREALIGRIVARRLREQLAGGVNLMMRWTRVALVLLAIGLTAVALAKPRMGYVQREIKTKGRDVLLAIDTSRSMLATDVAPTRLARAKLVSQDLMELLRGDRIGLVAFAGSAFLQAPLTLDYNAVRATLDELDTDLIPRGGSNLAAAIQTAIDAFGKAEGVLRALVIITDGEELDADGIAAAKRAGEAGIRIFTVGIGSEAGSLIPVDTPDGRSDFVRDAAGEPVMSKLDAGRLEEIAAATGGFYAPLSADVAREIFQRGIEPMEAQETGVMASRQPIEQYQWPLGGALGCLVLWILLGEGRRMRSVAGAGRKVGARRSVAAARVLGMVGMMLVGVGSARAEAGLEAYSKGDYAGALAEFEAQSETLLEREKLRFNAGASAYQSGDYAKAVDYFTEALLVEEEKLREDAAYNLGNSLVRRGEAAKSVEAKKTDWKDAIDHYTTALALNPDNRLAEENREMVKKMLEELEKQQEEQEKQDQPQDEKDQEEKDEEKKDEEKKDEEQKDQEQKNQEKKDEEKKDQQQQDQQDQQKQDEQDQQGKDGDQEPKDQEGEEGDEESKDQPEGPEPKDESGKDGEENQEKPRDPANSGEPTPSPTPGERKEGDVQANPDGEPAEPQEGGEAEGEPEEVEGEMSEAQARNLLRSMQGEEERVQQMERRAFQDVARDW